jgi:hypothetical protein
MKSKLMTVLVMVGGGFVLGLIAGFPAGRMQGMREPIPQSEAKFDLERCAWVRR